MTKMGFPCKLNLRYEILLEPLQTNKKKKKTISTSKTLFTLMTSLTGQKNQNCSVQSPQDTHLTCASVQFELLLLGENHSCSMITSYSYDWTKADRTHKTLYKNVSLTNCKLEVDD